MSKPVILTGIRSNSDLTLGNYLGAILPIVDMQKRHAGTYRINMFVPDLHSITTPVDYKALYNQTTNNLKYFVAAGLDIRQADTFIYRQSYLHEHAELAWVLECFIYFGELSRMTQFKEKSQQQSTVSVGLFNYPALMAADILLYDAEYVPVGEDQRQHLELTRDVALRMNQQFKKQLFIVPKPWNEQMEFARLNQGVRIRSLKNPEFKMSKSISDPSGTILISDQPDEARRKVMEATTDSMSSINFDYQGQPGISNLLQINALLSKQSLDDTIKQWRGQTNYRELKQSTADLIATFLEDIQLKMANVSEQTLLDKLAQDEAVMHEIAQAKVNEVFQAVGLRPSSLK